MGVDANVAAVSDFIERAWNGGDESVFAEHLSPSFPFPGGRDGFKQMIFMYREAFGGFHMEVHDIFGAGDKVVTILTMHGTHTGEFLGVAPTGRQISMSGIAVDMMRDGQRVGGGAELDQLGLLQQLGAVSSKYSLF
jgi:predicted ester cyclase